MGEVTRPVAGPAARGRAAPVLAWALAAGALVVAVGLALTVPADVPLLRGLPQVASWVAVVVLAGGLVSGDRRMAPFAAVAVPLAATAALVDEGGPVDATAVVIGAAGWLCLELTASSLEARTRRRRAVTTVRRRVGEVGAVVAGGAVVSLTALTVATDAAAANVVLRAFGVIAAVALIGLVAWLASGADAPE